MKFVTLSTMIIFFVALVGTIMAASNSIYSANNVLIDQIHKDLGRIAELKVQNVEIFLNMVKERMVDFSSDDKIENCLYNFENNITNSCTTKELTRYLTNNKLLITKELSEVFVMNIKGVIVASTKKENIGLDEKDSLYFINNGKKVHFGGPYFSKITDKNSFIISAPIFKDKQFIGVIVGRIKSKEFYNFLKSKNSLGKTEDIYIINSEGYLVTPSKFLRGKNKGVLTQVVNTDNSRECLKNIKENYNSKTKKIEEHKKRLIVSKDYRGENVFGVHSHVNGMQWCLLVEVDKKEVLNIPRMNFIRNQISISIFFLIFFTLFGFFIGRYFDTKYILKKIKKNKNNNNKSKVHNVNLSLVLSFALIFTIAYFFIITYLFQGWQNAQFFDDIWDMVFLVIFLTLLGYAFRLKNLEVRKFLLLGSGFFVLQRMLEIFLQEYQATVGLLDISYQIPTMVLGLLGIFMILFMFEEVIK